MYAGEIVESAPVRELFAAPSHPTRAASSRRVRGPTAGFARWRGPSPRRAGVRRLRLRAALPGGLRALSRRATGLEKVPDRAAEAACFLWDGGRIA